MLLRNQLAVLVTVAIGLFAWALPSSAAATSHWSPLLKCPDVNGNDGVVDGTPGVVNGPDIAAVVLKFGTTQAGVGDYVLLYDVKGGGSINGPDIATVVLRFGDTCPVVETEVAQATLAMDKYRDQSVALGEGYGPVTQNLQGHGIHYLKAALMADGPGGFDVTEPEGLNYSSDGELLSAFWIYPMFDPFNYPKPEGFTGDDDAWHSHPHSHEGGGMEMLGFCTWQEPGQGPMVAETYMAESISTGEMVLVEVTEPWCEDPPPAGKGGTWWPKFGWMQHLWNYLPNPDGRFTQENPDAGVDGDPVHPPVP